MSPELFEKVRQCYGHCQAPAEERWGFSYTLLPRFPGLVTISSASPTRHPWDSLGKFQRHPLCGTQFV